ncbi:hypothetical protein HDU91_000768 [Kappamyces sp. JEL0680]|nr:hypothetical protein HDU91_000768 [Kappamyces sp. JEL0680]
MTIKRKPEEGNAKKPPRQTTLVPPLVNWTMEQSVKVGVYYGSASAQDGPECTSKVAAFDFDGTLACLTGSHTWPKSGEDWLADLGFTLAIISNQKGIQENQKRRNCFVGRIEKTAKELHKYCKSLERKTPGFIVLAATETDIYRKPRVGMWILYKRLFSGPGSAPTKLEFYCGDASGRMGDHADTDLKWALNVDVPFYLPEQLFGDEASELYEKEPLSFHLLPAASSCPKLPFDPKSLLASKIDPDLKEALQRYQVIVCVGPPASGKSTFCFLHLPDHHRVNQDTLKTAPKCIKAAAEHVAAGKNVVIDNTNPTKQVRESYVRLCPRDKVACLYFALPDHVVQHNDAFREHAHAYKALLDIPGKSFDAKHVPGVAYHSYYSKFQEPQLEEGFDRIFTIDFYPHFPPDHPEDAQLWQLYWV